MNKKRLYNKWLRRVTQTDVGAEIPSFALTSMRTCRLAVSTFGFLPLRAESFADPFFWSHSLASHLTSAMVRRYSVVAMQMHRVPPELLPSMATMLTYACSGQSKLWMMSLMSVPSSSIPSSGKFANSLKLVASEPIPVLLLNAKRSRRSHT